MKIETGRNALKNRAIVCLGLLGCLFMILTGCISIPTGDGGSIKLSNEGLQIQSSDGEQTLAIENKETGFQITQKDEQGQEITAKVSYELPEKFPINIPVPDNATEVTSLESEYDGTKMYGLSFEVPNASVYDYYQIYIDFLNQENFENIIDNTYGNADETTNFAILSGSKGEETLNIKLTVTGTGKYDREAINIGLSYIIKN